MAARSDIPPTIRGLMHIALLRRLSLIPITRRRARRQAIDEFLAAQSEKQAREFIHEARLKVRTAELAKRRSRARRSARDRD